MRQRQDRGHEATGGKISLEAPGKKGGAKMEKGKDHKRRKKKRLILSVILAGLLMFLLMGFNETLLVRHYHLQTDLIDEPLTFVLLADLHSNFYGQEQEELIQAIENLHPDGIFLAGDIADDKIPHEGMICLMEGLGYQKQPGRDEGLPAAFYVTGNHEYWGGKADQVKEILTQRGVRVLENQSVLLEVKGEKLYICGMEDPDSNRYVPQMLKETFQAVPRQDRQYFSILLAHRPELISTYLQYPCDLILSGHAHGGQWRIPGLIDGIYAPNQGFFPENAGGIRYYPDKVHIISRGLARDTTAVPRFYNRPELVAIHLSPQTDKE